MMGEMEFLNQLVGEAEGMEDRYNVSSADVLVLQIALNSVQVQVFVINGFVIDMLRKTFLCIEVAPLCSMNEKIQDIFVWKKRF
jgi:hypothetical protein